MGWMYRAKQFWSAWHSSPSIEDLDQARRILPPPLMDLFLRMQPGEQAHSLEVYRRLVSQGADDLALLQAALLHDVGKSLYPLRLWERVEIVLIKTVFPTKARQWGQGPANGWRRALTVAEQHPNWGAQLARTAGAAPQMVNLISRHQEPLDGLASNTEEDRLLRMLQSCDDES